MKITFSSAIAFLIFGYFLYVFGGRIYEATQNERTCFQAYDGYGYYMYLPHLFEKGNLDITPEWAQKRQDAYCPGIPVYQFERRENGHYINIYHMGLALVELPAYCVGDLVAKIGGYQQDGMSKPYHIAFLINVLLFIGIGLIYTRKLLLQFMGDRQAGHALLIIYIATNIPIVFAESYQLQHLFLFALNAVFLYYLIRYIRTKNPRSLLLSAAIFGLTCFIRPTQAIWGIVPLIMLFNGWSQWLQLFKQLIWFPVFAFIFNIPHFLYWKLIGDSWFLPNLHTEDVVLADPNLVNFLFSFKKGWLIYSPIFLLLIPGFVYTYRNYRRLFWAAISFIVIDIYILCSWECWWYAASYGSRPMVDAYALFALIIGIGLSHLFKQQILALLSALFIVSCTVLNGLQSIQFKKGYLHYERMTAEQYRYIFGKTEIQNFHPFYLEIDRGDIHWPEQPFYKEGHGLHVSKKRIFELTESLETVPHLDLHITQIPIYQKLSTDETLLEVTMTCRTSDSTKAAPVQFQMMSKYNFYSWNNTELSQGFPSDSSYTVTYRFNLPHIRHSADALNIYVYNPDSLNLHIESMQIDAYSLIRE